jgi:hypothetical protein
VSLQTQIKGSPPLRQAAAASTAIAADGQMKPASVGFWRRWWVQNVLPWAGSVTLHISLIVLILVTYKAAGRYFKVVEEQVIIPDTTLAADPGGVPNPGMGNERDRAAEQDLDSAVSPSTGLAHSRSNLESLLINTPDDNATSGPGGMLSQFPARARDKSAGIGTANESGGALAQFGNPGGGQVGPRGRVFGHGGNAYKICYICDASGSMLTKMDLLKLELEKSVFQLQASQAFDVIFFQDSVGAPSSHIDFAPDLLMATAGNKRKLDAFLQNIVGQSSTHVIPALNAAFDLPTRPELIYLLTDGAFEDEGAPAVISAIHRLNSDKHIKINTILFLGQDIGDEELADAKTAMQRIATENDGVYNQVSISELGN